MNTVPKNKTLKLMDPINELARQIGAYFNIELTESNFKRLRYYCEEYQNKMPAKVEQVVKIKEVEVIREVKLLGKSEGSKLPLEIIADKVCSDLGYPVEVLQSKSRKDEHVDCRQIFAIRAFEEGYNKSQIGRFLKRDHTTIIHYLSERKPHHQQSA